MLEIRLLGEIAVIRDGRPVDSPRSRKTLALLAYLAATGRRQRRDHLCGLLWELPDDPRGALRWSLSKARALVDEPDRKRIVADRNTVAFERAGAYVDLFEVREACTAGLEALPTERLKDLAVAFRGAFLEGLELDHCSNFQRWCMVEREHLRGVHAEILRALVGQLAETPEAAFRFARDLAEIEANGEFAAARLEPLGAPARPRETIATASPADPTPPLSDKPSIAVLPFANLSGDAKQEQLADGIAEDVIID